jgi:hypothetical protein
MADYSVREGGLREGSRSSGLLKESHDIGWHCHHSGSSCSHRIIVIKTEMRLNAKC